MENLVYVDFTDIRRPFKIRFIIVIISVLQHCAIGLRIRWLETATILSGSW